MNIQWLEFAFWTAGSNWLTWRSDFEFADDPANMPVLRCQHRYRIFIKKYSLLRYYTRSERDSLRVRLLASDDFRSAVNAQDGSGIDKLAHCLSKEFLGFDVERSFVSKLAAFAKPASFVAWDRFARRGVDTLANGRSSGNYKSYSAYLKDVNKVLNDTFGQEIRGLLADKKLPTENNEGFIRRVLDVYLMVQGGFWFAELA